MQGLNCLLALRQCDVFQKLLGGKTVEYFPFNNVYPKCI